MERDRFLSRVSGAVMASSLPTAPTVPERLPDLEPVENLALFRERAHAADAVVHGPVSRHGVPRAVTGIAAGHGCRTYAAWDELPSAGVAAALATAGLDRVDHVVPDERREERQLAYLDLDLGVTAAIAGLAESGSVVMLHGSGRPRMVSAISEVNVVLLEVTAIDRTLAHWAARHPQLHRETANLVVVTGPSRTGDIELKLNLGVHGPRHLHVVLIR